MRFKNYEFKNIQEFLEGFKKMFQDFKSPKTLKKQIPNMLTLSRAILAIFIPPVALSGNLALAGGLTVLAVSTDAVDGFAARKLGAVSEFGKNLDPVCDKLLAAFLTVPLIFKLPVIMKLGLGVNLALEASIANTNLKSQLKGNKPRTTIMGKIKTISLSALLAALYISLTHQSVNVLVPFLYGTTALTQVIALREYQEIDKAKTDKQMIAKVEANDIEPKKEEKTLDKEKELKPTLEEYKNFKEELNRLYHIEPEKEIKQKQKEK